MRPLALLLLALGPAVWSAPLRAAPGDAMTFKNNLLPGQWSEHRLKRVILRTTQKDKVPEKLVYRQTAEWLRCNIDEGKPGSMVLYQMMVDQAPKVVSLSRGKKKVSPTPSASRFNLPKGSTRLHSATVTARDAPIQAPMADPVQHAILTAFLDFAHWPEGSVNAGHRWERDISCEGFEGKQTFEFVDLVKVGDQMTARVTLFVEGKFTSGLEREYSFDKGQALLYWSRPERMLVKMEAQAGYERSRGAKPERYELKFNADLARTKSLSEDEQELVKVQLTAFAQALEKLRAKDARSALAICREFRTRWPDSRWLPAVAELESQAAPKPTSDDRLSAEQLKKVLVQTIVAWEAARSTGEHDLRDKAVDTLAQLANEYRTKLARLARDKDDAVRSQAIFAIALGNSPDDLATVQSAVKDKVPKVRAMALAGLAARGKSDVNVELLIARLDDKESIVRRRACQAVAVCVEPEHYSIVAVAEKLGRLMVDDENDLVRKEAIRALAVVGAPADIPRLEKALTHELNQSNRAEIERAIAALRKKS
ncbi:MAG TPA: HEAT repeat domain-containing protein [Phycisphaerae bacterium]|nr:HEAT repeat domain-containing protein [Phycisphaerae bacterium]